MSVTLIATGSSLVNHFGYVPDTQELVLVLRGVLNVYKGVEVEIFTGLKAAESKGKFYNQVIRPRKFQFENLGAYTV